MHTVLRLPMVRHLRYLYYRWQYDNHYVFGQSYYLQTADDTAHLAAIWHGEA